MKRKLVPTIFMLVAIGWSLLQPFPAYADDGAPARRASARTLKPGDYTYTIQHDGLNRMYRVYVPSTLRRGSAAPVLFAFHGGGGNMNYQAEGYGLIPKAEKEGFVAVFPNGFSFNADGTDATWNAGKCCGAAQFKKIDDAGFVRQIVTDLSRKIDIDRNRLYATGMSNGGMLSYRLACELADVFKAIAPVAGTDNTLSCSPAKPVSVIHFHAKDDTHVPFNGGKGPDSKVDVEFTSVAASISKWVMLDGCASTPTRVLEVEGAYCDRYTSCQNKTQVEVCVTETGGHSWPGNPPRRGETPSQAIKANDVMWAFFEQLGNRR